MITKLAIAPLMLLMAIPTIHAKGHPTWSEFEAIFGLRLESREFKKFVERHNLWDGYTKPSKELGVWVKSKDGAFRIKHEEHKAIKGWVCVTGIEFRVANWPADQKGRRSYSAKLPFGLERGFQKADIEAKFGRSKPVDPRRGVVPRSMEGYTWRIDDLEIRAHFDKKTAQFMELHVTDLKVAGRIK